MLHFEKVKYTGKKDRLTLDEFHKIVEYDANNKYINECHSINNQSVKTKKEKQKNKYKSKKFQIGDKWFDSQKEAKRYADLSALERSGVIKNLQTQKRFELIPAQKDNSGKILERACYYYADFVYERCDGVQIVEDVKSKATKTPQYIIKRKLMLKNYGIRIQEIE